MLCSSCDILDLLSEIGKSLEGNDFIYRLYAKLLIGVVSSDEYLPKWVKSQWMSFSTWNFNELRITLTIEYFNFHRSKSMLSCVQASRSIWTVSPTIKVAVAHYCSGLISSTRDLSNKAVITISLKWVNKQGSWWFNQGWVSNTELTLGVTSKREQKAVSRYEGSMEVSAWNLIDNNVEREWFRLIAVLQRRKILLLIIIRVGKSELTVRIWTPGEKLCVRRCFSIELVIITLDWIRFFHRQFMN